MHDGQVGKESKPLDYYINQPGMPESLVKQLKYWADILPNAEVEQLDFYSGRSMNSHHTYCCILIASGTDDVKITIKLEG